MCAAVDEEFGTTWTQLAPSEKHMISFLNELVILISKLGLKVKNIHSNNAGECQTALQEFCSVNGMVTEYTAPS